MADDVRKCQRCGNLHVGAPSLAPLPTLNVCPSCGTFTVVRVMREMGEMTDPDDRADPSEWGSLGQ